MKRNLILIIVAVLVVLWADLAKAWQLEASFGRTYYTGSNMQGGDWRQSGPTSQGFRDEFHLNPTSYTIGATGDLASNWKWRAGYADLGKATSTAIATKWDMDFDFQNQVCTRNCDALTTFVGSSEVQGVYATAVREFKAGDYTLSLEAGAWLYRNKFKLWVYNPVGTSAPYFTEESYGLGEMDIKNKYTVGPVFGFGVGKGNATLAMTAYTVRHSGFVSINDGKPYAWNASLRVRF